MLQEMAGGKHLRIKFSRTVIRYMYSAILSKRKKVLIIEGKRKTGMRLVEKRETGMLLHRKTRQTC
jgi:hypothetical protein